MEKPNEMEYLMNSNAWIGTERRQVTVAGGVYVDQDLSKWKAHDVVLSTGGDDHVMEFGTLTRILEVMPQALHWDGKLSLGIGLGGDEAWTTVLHERASRTRGTICFLNFERHGLVKSETHVYLEEEGAKRHLLDDLLKGATVTIEAGASRRVVSTSTRPVKQLTAGCPPARCDILVARSELVDAIPAPCLDRYVRPHGVVVHFGRLESKRHAAATAAHTRIDSRALPGLNSYEDWVDCFCAYVSAAHVAS